MTSNGGSNSSNPFGDTMLTKFHLKWEAAESAYEVAKEKDYTVMRLEDMKFLAISMKAFVYNDEEERQEEG
ncbi:hypothetical protein Tco_0703145 [Tanacetum coccineum]|uniref:Uncharacterized protein n=1 Tax=Tanacetum coccineum TaxID=301880 RepID=A0ABQ4XY53_9ASTR